MKVKRITALAVAIAVTIGLAACGGNDIGGGETSEINFNGYPIQTDETLTYWVTLNSSLSGTAQNLAESPFGKALAEQVGVDITYIHPAAGQTDMQFSVMVASNSMPDIIEYNWLTFAGGPQKAIDDGTIIPLNDAYNKYAPNLNSLLSEHPEFDKMVKTDDGVYYAFPFLIMDDILLTPQGPIIRDDWMEELGLEYPETLDDWHYVLTQFKERKNVSAPLSLVNGEINHFIGAYGISTEFFLENGRIVYGSADPRYKTALGVLAKWYAEGLLDSNFVNVDHSTLTAGILNNSVGATVRFAGSGLGVFINALKEKDENASMVPLPFPTLNKGDVPPRGYRNAQYIGTSGAITTSCKNVELAARVLDYGYSEEGNLLFNFGIEGESYEMIDGYPTYTDIIMNNPDGLNISQAMARYIKSSTSGIFVQRPEYMEQYYTLPQQKMVFDTWTKNNEKDYKLPPLTFTSDESSEVAGIMNNIKTYVDEQTYKYIMGREDLSTFDNYLATIQGFGLGKALKIYEDAYDRYLKR